jgi:hypothetical protein
MTAADFEVTGQMDDVVAGRRLAQIGLASVIIGAVGVFFGGLIVCCSSGALRPSFAGRRGPQRAPDEISHVEQTQVWNAERGIDLRRAQLRELERWGWADRDAGLARIPIEQAMDIVAAREGER